MVQEVAGKVALVTGGAGGIGRATVEILIEEGAQVVIADVDVANGEALAKELGTAAIFVKTDTSSADDVQRAIDTAVSHFGGLHIMFNNAGISSKTPASFLDNDLSDFQRVIDINLMGVIYGCQRAARHMTKNGGGSIINTAAIAGLLPGFSFLSYRAAKAALMHISQSIAIELAAHNVRVNCIAPGSTRTLMNSYAQPGTEQAEIDRISTAIEPAMLSNQPLKRRSTPRDVANSVLFLASDRSSQITGIILPVDGGVAAGDPVNRLELIVAAREQAMRQ